MLRAGAGGTPLAQYAELLDALNGLTWPSASRARAGEPGAHRSTRLGRSPEFTEYRAYRPGDDLRRLDWKLFGRTDRPFLRIADDHASLKTVIVVDASASMRFPPTGNGKWEHACAIALGLMSVAIGEGDAAGVTISMRSGDKRIPARRRRDLLYDAAELFAAITPSGETALAESVHRAESPPRLVVITDFLGAAEQALPELRIAAAAGSELVAVHVAASAELDPPDRAFVASDPEEPGFQRAMDATNRAGYEAAFAAWRERIAGELRAMQATYVLTSTEDLARDAVRRVVGGRAALAAPVAP